MARSFDLPVFKGFAGFRADWWRSDISAGLAVAAVGLPSAIAYPAIAGLPPQTGIYASVASVVAYAVFGPSRRLIVGPDAGSMTVLAAAMAAIIAAAPAAGTDRVALAAILAIGVGVLCLVARVLKLGVLATFLSRPILVGFFAGISLSILIGQIGRFTGLSIESGGLIAPILELIDKRASIHWPSVMLAGAMFALLQAARVMRSPIPGPVIVVVVSVLLSAVFGFQQRGIAVVGGIPTGLPSLHMPQLSGLPIDMFILGSAAVFLVSFGSGIVAARSFGSRLGDEVDPNRELVGFSAANIGSGLFGAFPVTVSDSRTAINVSVGGMSQLAGIVSAATLIATLLFFNDALRILPIPALAAILAAAAISLIDVEELRLLWRISRMEFAFALITMAGAISFGVLNGVIIAIAATLIYLLRKVMYPRDALLGRIAGRDGFYKLHRFAQAEPIPGLAICMIQDSLLFFNADYVRQRLRQIADDLPAGTKWFVLDAATVAQVDSTSAAMLGEIHAEFTKRGIVFAIAELHTEARSLLDRAGVIARIGPHRLFDDLDDALIAFKEEQLGVSGSPGP
ncbi:SulP family inorganic anion transporter [Rhizobiaceae bacterium n13]|uniref:SulP family inorganic anion transporter n=1 Tax=Ferirhizobium litorale TaxID=2927786 RepID=A0AAE3QJ31_9HYPH|nr:SulP family inorganic anion transporter [Fererhizobium litorale]MDI7864476.1 SulP family inorganic anion transporter [Fererhizobium litorale]MDI7924773.1 SulP family inorganic anion transporter [Fererhizobium litorale]